MKRTISAGLAAAASGAASGWLRPMLGHVHYEAIASLLVIMPAICLALVWSFRAVPLRHAARSLTALIAWTCLIFGAAWAIAQPSFTDDLLGIMSLYLAIAAPAALLLLFLLQCFRCPVYGPYCPQCAYCLIGAADRRCPECGRPFTLRELGITPDQLQPPQREVAPR